MREGAEPGIPMQHDEWWQTATRFITAWFAIVTIAAVVLLVVQ